MKKLLIRLQTAIFIVCLLWGYNYIVGIRAEADSRAKAQADAINAEIMAQNAALQEEASQEAAGKYKDGEYEAAAQGFGGDIDLKVTISGGQITDIAIVSAENEDKSYFAMAEDIIPSIIEAQSADVDTISGATFSSTGIRNAVAQALEEAAN